MKQNATARDALHRSGLVQRTSKSPPVRSKNLARYTAETFIENTSLRGIRKCYTTQHKPLRLHWLLYLLSMTIIVLYGSYELLREYMEFHTTYQTEEKLDDPTDFPNIAVCSVYPFSPRAADLWRTGKMKSPADLSRELRRGIGQYVSRGMYTEAAALFHNDKVATYFQQLNDSQLAQVEHSMTDLVPLCSMRHSPNANPSVAHMEPCKFIIRRINSPNYLTCYSLQLLKEKSSYVSDVSLVLSNVHYKELLGKSNLTGLIDFQLRATEEHVYNILTEGSGFRIALHEPNTYPQLEENGFSVQMQSSTVIRYRAMRYEKDYRQTDECADDWQTASVWDFDRNFVYTKSACISSHIGRYILRRCSCVSAYHMRFRQPTQKVPYCGRYDSEDPGGFVKRLNCVRGLNLTQLIRHLSEGACRPRCSHLVYESHLSSSNWKPSLCQFYWLSHITGALSSLEGNPHDSRARQQLLSFSELESILTVPELRRLQAFEPLAQKSMALVTVTRANYNTVVSREKLQITLSALMSRLGGLGSLTIGMTLTFAFELVELLYLLGRRIWLRCGANSSAGHASPDQAAEQVTVKGLRRQHQEWFNISGTSDSSSGGKGRDPDYDCHARQESFYDNVPRPGH